MVWATSGPDSRGSMPPPVVKATAASSLSRSCGWLASIRWASSMSGRGRLTGRNNQRHAEEPSAASAAKSSSTRTAAGSTST
ncbi:MAG: hypothetical protein ACYTGX_16885 [Planctomycetota bacterium]